MPLPIAPHDLVWRKAHAMGYTPEEFDTIHSAVEGNVEDTMPLASVKARAHATELCVWLAIHGCGQFSFADPLYNDFVNLTNATRALGYELDMKSLELELKSERIDALLGTVQALKTGHGLKKLRVDGAAEAIRASMKRNLADITQENQELKQLNETMSDALRSREKIIETQKEKIDKLQGMYEYQDRKNQEEIAERCDDLQDELDRKGERVRELKGRLKEKDEEIIEQVQTIEEQDSELYEDRNTIKDLKKEIKELNYQFDDVCVEIDEVREELDDVREELNGVRAELDTSQELVETLQADNSNLHTTITHQSGVIAQKTASIELASKTAADVARAHDQALGAQVKIVNTLEKKIEGLEKTIKVLNEAKTGKRELDKSGEDVEHVEKRVRGS